MKVLVTGAAGFIGFHTASRLLERGDEVVGLDNLNEYYDVKLKLRRLEILGKAPDLTFRFLPDEGVDSAPTTPSPTWDCEVDATASVSAATT